jgi:hypothetical protein
MYTTGSRAFAKATGIDWRKSKRLGHQGKSPGLSQKHHQAESRKSGRFDSQFSIRDMSGDERLMEHRIRRRRDICLGFSPANSVPNKV